MMNLICSYSREPEEVVQLKNKEVSIFNINGGNIDKTVVNDFGQEWIKFSDFTDKRIKAAAAEYFDIIDEKMVNKETYALDIGCGTGRWTKYLASKAGFIEAIDPSEAIFAADKLLSQVQNVRLTKASIDTIPFPDETFDFAMSVGVLHHVPDTKKALIDCVKKVKGGGYFYVYLYYNLDSRGFAMKALFKFTNVIRNVISRMPSKIKVAVCDIISLVIYFPFILLARFLFLTGFPRLAKKMPLSAYSNKPYFIIRNDALDRFGTRLEQRFSKDEIGKMMENAGLTEIRFSPGVPYYHAVGKKL